MDNSGKFSEINFIDTQADILLSSRARYARNTVHEVFPNRISKQNASRVCAMAHVAWKEVFGEDNIYYANGKDLTEQRWYEKVEFHEVTKKWVQLSKKRPCCYLKHLQEPFSMMVNEEDHFRSQVILPGFQIGHALQKLQKLDAQLASRLDYAQSQTFGLQTQCLSNTGSALRLGVMLALPALTLANWIPHLKNTMQDCRFALRGFMGDESPFYGELFQLSNQKTFGVTEEKTLSDFHEHIVPMVNAYESKARDYLMSKEQRIKTEDLIGRAHGTLMNSRLIGFREFADVISKIRLGLCLDIIPANEQRMKQVTEMLWTMRPGALSSSFNQPLARPQIEELRAQLSQEIFTGLGLS